MGSISYFKNYVSQRAVKSVLQRFPKLYIDIQLFRYKGKRYQRKIITPQSDIVIEGYPRSANSFSVKAFKFANGEDTYKIATHLHAYPQIIMGVKYNVPTIVLVREPFQCISSYAALRAQNYGVAKFNKNYNVKWLLKDYVDFYTELKPHKEKVVVAPFTEVLKDYGRFIKEVNTKYGTDFIPFDHTDENVKTVFATSKDHLSPSEEREEIKKLYKEEILKLKNTSLFKEAEALYQYWIS